ncbi:hypothetical protein DSCW_17700 [Desulfosarcina widdelii]|uniref:AbiTii domain-containing protein n=1 Tax=Desulfosarcina widdelii TaxID=947919 RepID=A0A5K7Z2Q3_9BACT|nr:hypothetical protein [Desulfosarcina widdelii]BBO74353.1 hypothetical protein DSCW_17700 [Desulfosarcina widdelii]
MKSLVLELQSEAMNPNSRLSDILRKALVVAKKLKINDFKSWIDSEMKGYQKEAIIPSYRNVKGSLKAWNPYNGWIPVVMENSEAMEAISKRDIGQPISELESLIHEKEKGGVLQVPLPHDWIMKLFSHSEQFRLGMVPTLLVDRSQIFRILDSVRNEILNWSLELENQGILGDGMSFSIEEINKAGSVTYNIKSFKGILGDVTSSNVQVGDYSSIHDSLKEKGVTQKERNELENLLDELKKADPSQRKSLIQRGFCWVNRNASTIGTLSSTIKNWFDMLN